MTDVSTPEPGSFCISELHTPDVDASTRFYGDLFGWTAVPAPGAAPDYLLFQHEGRDVAALRRVPDTRQRWVSHVFVPSVDEAAARAAQLGADVSAAVQTHGVARTRIIRDPEGAELGLWEAGGHRGAELVDVSGSMWWMELMARDITAARRFYTTLFGWSFFETPKYGIPYTVFTLGEQSAAGAVQFEPDWGITPRWQVFFAVDSFAATVKQACATGGSLGFWRDVPTVGRLGTINDPGGALFNVMDPTQLRVPS